MKNKWIGALSIHLLYVSLINRNHYKLLTMGNLVETIKMKLNTNFNGVLDCEEQRADLFAYVDGNEATITKIDTEVIHFDGFEINLIDADIHTLAYINEVLG